MCFTCKFTKVYFLKYFYKHFIGINKKLSILLLLLLWVGLKIVFWYFSSPWTENGSNKMKSFSRSNKYCHARDIDPKKEHKIKCFLVLWISFLISNLPYDKIVLVWGLFEDCLIKLVFLSSLFCLFYRNLYKVGKKNSNTFSSISFPFFSFWMCWILASIFLLMGNFYYGCNSKKPFFFFHVCVYGYVSE